MIIRQLTEEEAKQQNFYKSGIIKSRNKLIKNK